MSPLNLIDSYIGKVFSSPWILKIIYVDGEEDTDVNVANFRKNLGSIERNFL